MSGHALAASIRRADANCAHVNEFLAEVSDEVRKIVPFDGGLWFGVDPATLLAAPPARLEALDPTLCEVFWNSEFHENDVLRFRDLARQLEPAGALRMATGDKPLRSPRFRELMRVQGYDDEARVIFRTGKTTWAAAAIYRDKGRPAFDANEVEILGSISQTVAAALRERTVPASPSIRTVEALRAPGVLLVDSRGGLISANLHAKAWLRHIYGTDLDARLSASQLAQTFTTMSLLATHARAIAAGYDDGPARLRCRDREGRWIVMHASCMDETDPDSQIAVVIEPAQSAEIAPIIIEAYGLTPREREVLRGIARGLSTPEIAAELFLSSHTVRDYIKSVFEKTGVGSRGELTAKLFAEHYLDDFQASAVFV